jgi:hypothetical protein
MFNRTLAIGAVIVLTAAVIAAALIQPAIGPRASRADYKAATISPEDLHRQVDHHNLPIQSIPEPYRVLRLKRLETVSTAPGGALETRHGITLSAGHGVTGPAIQ